MKRIGYINSKHYINTLALFINTFKQYYCYDILIEPTDGSSREEWKLFIEKISEGDQVYLASLKSTFQTLNDFILFARFCETKKVSIFSIGDGITPYSASQNLLRALTILPNSKPMSDTEFEVNSKKYKLLKKHMKVINMYRSGYSAKEIMSVNEYKGKYSIYDILNKYGIEHEYPSMSRKKNKEQQSI